VVTRSSPGEDVYLTLQLVAPLKSLHPPQGIYHPLLPGEKWMTLTTKLNLHRLPGGANGKGIATGTNYLGIGKILGMNLRLHTI
jgi:hypothetical protein